MKKYYKNENDHLYFTPIAISLLIFIPNIIFVHYMMITNTFTIQKIICYHLIMLCPLNKFFAYISTMSHKEGHYHNVRIYKNNSVFLNKMCEYFIGLYYGILPGSYTIAHRKIHHLYHGAYGDNMLILDCNRTSVTHFIWNVTQMMLNFLGISSLFHLFYTLNDVKLIEKTFISFYIILQ